MDLPEAFTQRMQTQLGGDYAAFLRCYDQPPVRGLRVNTLKLSPAAFAPLAPWPLIPSAVLEEGFILCSEAPVGRHPYHMAGLFYMQEPSAMAPIALLDPRPGMRVLDLCAAPGGKSTAIAARLKGEGLLLSNELVPSRAKVLLENLQRMGATNAVVSCARPDALCAALPGYFDAVLVDAPCAGEGMFRKDPEAVRAWSPAHVQACAQRQAAILQSAAQTLRPGGRLVYSTCTFSTEENEDVIKAFLLANPDFTLQTARRLYPHQMRGEGHFAALLCRAGNERPSLPHAALEPAPPLVRDALAEMLDTPLPVPALLPDGRVLLAPPDLPAPLLRLRLLCAGVEAGELRKNRFEPAHALFMAHGQHARRKLTLAPDDPQLTAFLQGNTLPAATRGYTAVCVQAWPLGFGKASDGVLKNRLPKGVRGR